MASQSLLIAESLYILLGFFLTWQFSAPLGTQDEVEVLKEIITILLTNPIYENSCHSVENLEPSLSMVLNRNKGWYFWHIVGFRWCWFRYWDSPCKWCFPGGSVVKNLPAMQETQRSRLNPWVWKIPWRRKWQPTPVFLPGKSHGQRSMMAYSP